VTQILKKWFESKVPSSSLMMFGLNILVYEILKTLLVPSFAIFELDFSFVK